MDSLELQRTFRMSLEESMVVVLTHYDTHKEEEEDEAMERSGGWMVDEAQMGESRVANETGRSMKF